MSAKKWIRITPHFTFSEFFSQTKSGRIKNADIYKAFRLARMILEPLRKALHDQPITVTSGKRSSTHNRKRGYARTSDHLFSDECGAVDISFSNREDNRHAAHWLFDNKLGCIGQLIIYVDLENVVRWLHISLPSKKHYGETLIATVETPRKYSFYNGGKISRPIDKEEK